MPLIHVMSPKGGTGKTTLCANLAEAFKRLGYRVVMVDFDPQNALCLHFRFDLGDDRGLMARFDSEMDWRALLLAVGDNLELLPFGLGGTHRQQQLSRMLSQRDFVESRLNGLARTNNTLVILDTPSGIGPVTEMAREIADLSLVTWLADPASLAMLPRLTFAQRGSDSPTGTHEGFHIVNQVDARSALNREIVDVMKARFQSSLVGLIHRDEALIEALAEQMSVFELAPASAAGRDIGDIAKLIAERFPLKFAGNGGRPLEP